MWIVSLQRSPGREYAYGPFGDEGAANDFAGFLTAEVDPAIVLPLRSPVRELLSWRNTVTGDGAGRPQPWVADPLSRVIASRVQWLRIRNAWPYEEIAERAAAYDLKWSAAEWAAIEDAVDGMHARPFTAAEVNALAALFGVTPNDLHGTTSTKPSEESTRP